MELKDKSQRFGTTEISDPCFHLDFYLPDYNIAIECQGEQHFEPVEYFGGKEKFESLQKKDKLKKELCKKNNVKLLEFSDYQYNKELITDVNDLIKKIYEKENR